MSIATKETLLQIVDAFIAVNAGLRDVTISYRMFGDSKKLAALRGDADITLGRFNSAMVWLATNWPEGHDLPPHLVPYVPPTTPKEDAA
jgi:hypothetical protein